MAELERLKGLIGVIFIISDGIRGHVNQSRGVAHFLSALVGCEVYELEVKPDIKNLSFAGRSGDVKLNRIKKLVYLVRRFYIMKISAKRLAGQGKRRIFRWLRCADGESLLREAREVLNRSTEGNFASELKASPDRPAFDEEKSKAVTTASTPKKLGAFGMNVLFLSAGSLSAPYCLALARLCGGKCATIMTPSALGVKPFDFAIVPDHDFPKASEKVLVTLGAPNFVTPERIKEESQKLSGLYPPRSGVRIGLLLGGSDGNYQITPRWVKENVRPLLEFATRERADVYITTSRRTSRETEQALETLSKRYPCVRYLCIASRDPYNPVYGIFGLATHVLATEDSVSMISEAATAGFCTGVLPVEHKKGIKRVLEALILLFVKLKVLPPKKLFGIPKFTRAIDNFCEHGLARWVKDVTNLSCLPGKHDREFCEAKRAAEWIASNILNFICCKEKV
ncbi:MAG TPA: ELM1/GtrOC1 family putative glycosyltransferase [Acetomicrobium sp.]|nr:ELM1/GtrOC1 family putative glycosyltransferase [Acetomicrobium sp.]